MNWVLYPEVLSIMIAILAMVCALGLAFAYGVRHRLAWAQLPAAARDAELAARVKQREIELLDKEQRLERLGEQIRDREARLLERDQLEAEAEYWKSQIEAAKAEYAGLDMVRREIEEVRESFRQEMENLADAERQTRETKGQWEDARIRVAEAERRLAQVADEESRLRDTQQEWVQAVAEMENRLVAKKAERAEVLESLERGQDRLTRSERKVESLDARQQSLQAELRSYEERLKTVKTELDGLAPARQELGDVQESLQSVKRDLNDKRETLLSLESEQAWLNARIAHRRSELAKLDEPTITGTEDGANDSSLDDLLKPPACLARGDADSGYTPVLPGERPSEQEVDALQRVHAHLEESGLAFDQRVINAFHTSLKTAIISPLTVLAGVGGTGKSQLPRFYADAMGLHFLKIPVQPRWDGPQDLFGFYNYIEKRYKATDLARALVHLDRYNWPDQAKMFDDRVLLVLLDEMNLARVEYYFSEFLSRLEGRPLDEGADDEDLRRPAEIEIDVGRRGQPKRVYAGQNVLFVGTMNEDESTLSLSEKVLDRANVLRFPKPKELKPDLPTVDKRPKARGYLPKSRWTRHWTRRVTRMDDATRDRASRTVSEINATMDEMGRPFGHRMSQAILHYVANYPSHRRETDGPEAIDKALADQIELRILPRLRGVLVDEQRPRLDALARVAESLGDKALGDAIGSAIQKSRDTNGLFVWRGFTRQ